MENQDQHFPDYQLVSASLAFCPRIIDLSLSCPLFKLTDSDKSFLTKAHSALVHLYRFMVPGPREGIIRDLWIIYIFYTQVLGAVFVVYTYIGNLALQYCHAIVIVLLNRLDRNGTQILRDQDIHNLAGFWWQVVNCI